MQFPGSVFKRKRWLLFPLLLLPIGWNEEVMAGAHAAILDHEDNGCTAGRAGPVSQKAPGPRHVGGAAPHGLDCSPPDSYMGHEGWLLLTV